MRIWAMVFGAWCIGAVPSMACADQADVEQAMRRGSTLFWYDRAAWMTSDDLMARLPPDRLPEVGGWIVVPGNSGYHVYYHGKENAADSVVYEADVIGTQVSNAVIQPKQSAPRLPAQASAMAKALRLAWSAMANHADWQPCANARFNTVVLPPDADGSISVYFLTPQTVANSYPFGGHFEIVVSADGTEKSSRRFTNSCITMPKPAARSGAMPDALFLTHLLDSHPTEIHVFQQYAIGMPLYVGTQSPQTIWRVENGQVTVTDPPK